MTAKLVFEIKIIVQVVTILPPNSEALNESLGFSECNTVN